MIQSGGGFEAVSFARSTVEIVGDLSAAALPAVTVASTSASTGFNDRIRRYAMSGTGRSATVDGLPDSCVGIDFTSPDSASLRTENWEPELQPVNSH